MECTYDDLIIQGEAKKDENDAFCQLVDRYNGKKAIFIADRGYNHIAKEILPIRPRRSNLKVSDSLTIGMTNISYYSLYLMESQYYTFLASTNEKTRRLYPYDIFSG